MTGLPDIQRLEELADYARQRRAETARELLDAAHQLQAAQDALTQAQTDYRAAYKVATTDAWTPDELTEVGLPGPDTEAPTNRRRRAHTSRRHSTRKKTTEDTPQPAPSPDPNTL